MKSWVKRSSNKGKKPSGTISTTKMGFTFSRDIKEFFGENKIILQYDDSLSTDKLILQFISAPKDRENSFNEIFKINSKEFMYAKGFINYFKIETGVHKAKSILNGFEITIKRRV